MSLALSETVVQGLQSLGSIISLELTKKLIAQCIKLTLHPHATIPPIPEVYANNAEKVKQSEYAIVTLIALATKHYCESAVLRQVLEEHAVNKEVANELTQSYEAHRKELILRQLQVGHSFPHITDVQWRIVCDVKSSTTDRSSGEIGFIINLGRYDQHTGERETIVEFLCNTEELQSFINKLKEIERHCEKVALE